MPRATSAKKQVIEPPSLVTAHRPKRTRKPLSLTAALSHPKLFGPQFSNPSWDNWKIAAKAFDGERLTESQAEFFRTISGGREPPAQRVSEIHLVMGRRAGKDSIASVMAAHAAATFDCPHLLRGGERAMVLCLAPTRVQAQIVLRYIKSYFTDIPLLAPMVLGEMTKEGISLNNSVDIVVSSNSFKGVRGHPVLLAIFDETAFWSEEDSARPPEKLLAAVEPGLSSLQSAGSRIVSITTPFRRNGLVFNKFERHFGKDDDPDVLVLRAPSRTMNPTLSQSYVDKKLAKDFAKARCEYYAEFRDDVNGWLDRQIIDAAIDGAVVRPPRPEFSYVAFADPSGGKSDSFTLAIAHEEDGLAVLDCLVEAVPPMSHASVVANMAQVLREYRVHNVTGDRYGADLTVNLFATNGITYRHSERDRSAIYEDCLPLFTSGRVRLLNNEKLINQFTSLVRKPGSAGRDRIDHGPGGHDDLANSAAGALIAATSAERRPRLLFG